MTRPYTGRGDAGFTLVETLIATSIIAAMVALTVQVIANGAATTRSVIDRREAILVAQSALARARLPQETLPLTATARNRRWTWRIAAVTYGRPNGSALRLEKVTVTVLDARSGRSVTQLSSLRLVR